MKNISNKKIGEDFEKKLLNLLKENGFWATKLKEKENGGPFDIIATNSSGMFFGIEAKNIIKGYRFPVDRIETNQEMSIKRLDKLGVNNTWFIFNVVESDEIYVKKGIEVVNYKGKSIKIDEECMLFKEWLNNVAF